MRAELPNPGIESGPPSLQAILYQLNYQGNPFKQRRFYFFLCDFSAFCFSCLTALTKTSSTLLNKSDESGALLSSRKAFNLSPFNTVFSSVQFSSVAQSCLTLCDAMNRSTPGLPVHHQPPEFTQTHFHRVSDAIQPSHPLSSPSPPAPNPSQHQSLFQ